MTQRNREHLYSKFEQGAKPSEQDFRDLIDSTLNFQDDQIKRKDQELKVAAPLRVTTNPDDTEETLLKFYAGEENTWSINQKPGEDKVGFNISDANGASRLFIKSEDGNVGIGTTEPSAPLQVKATKETDPHKNGLYIYNPTDEENQHAILGLQVAGKKGGNPFISWDVKGDVNWSMGIDNQDENKLKIAPDWANLTNSTLMTFDGQGHVGIGTTKPQGKLQIGPDSKGIKLDDNGGLGVDIDSLGADLYLNYNQNNTSIGKEGFFKITAKKTVSIDGALTIGGDILWQPPSQSEEGLKKLIQVREIKNVIGHKDYDTGFSSVEWTCGIIGFKSTKGDINEHSGDFPIIQVHTFIKDQKWYIFADFHTHGKDHEDWTIWLMAISTKIASFS